VGDGRRAAGSRSTSCLCRTTSCRSKCLDAILAAGARTCAEAGVAIVGGIRCATRGQVRAVVTGDVERGGGGDGRTAARRPGQALVLTKAIGTGVIGPGDQERRGERGIGGRRDSGRMTTSIKSARDRRAHGVTAATDVTGFGLLGHLAQHRAPARSRRDHRAPRVPLLDGALRVHAREAVPAGSKANARTSRPNTYWQAARRCRRRATTRCAELLASLECGADSGGLLLCVPSERARPCTDELRAAGPARRVIARCASPARARRSTRLAIHRSIAAFESAAGSCTRIPPASSRSRSMKNRKTPRRPARKNRHTFAPPPGSSPRPACSCGRRRAHGKWCECGR